MGCSTPGSFVLHCLLEFAQSHVHWVRDANVVNATGGAHWPIWGAEASLHPWNNTHLIRTYEHFNVSWNILLRTSTCKLYWPVIFATHCHSSLVLVSGWCWIYKTSLKEFYPHAFWKTLGRICIINSLKMFGRIHHWRILVLDFGFWEAFDYWLSLLTIYHSVETVYIIMTQSW